MTECYIDLYELGEVYVVGVQGQLVQVRGGDALLQAGLGPGS